MMKELNFFAKYLMEVDQLDLILIIMKKDMIVMAT
jgi:hypothetical protein